MEIILKQFIDYDNCKNERTVHFTPDMDISLLTIDTAKFALIETDHFDKAHGKYGIENNLGVKFLEWIQPKKKVIISEDDGADGVFHDAVDVTIRHEGLVHALALVEQ